MKSKVLLMHLDADTIVSSNLTLNKLNSNSFNGIISMNVPNDRAFKDTMPYQVGDAYEVNYQIVVENIYSDADNTLLQKLYYRDSDRVFIRLGYPKNYIIDSVTPVVGTDDYNYTTWIEDSFDKSLLDNYVTKDQLLNRFLPSTTEINDRIDNKYFKYIRHLEIDEDLNGSNFKTGFYSVNGTVVNGPTTSAIEGMLEVYMTSEMNFYILYITSPTAIQNMYIKTYNRGNGGRTDWWKPEEMSFYDDINNHAVGHDNVWRTSIISGSYLSAGTGTNESSTRMSALSPDDAPIYTMRFPNSFALSGSYLLIEPYGIARREWVYVYTNGTTKNTGRWG